MEKNKKTKDEEKTEEEENKDNQDRVLVMQAKRLEQESRDARRKYDWEWLVRQLYVRGYHFARYNRGSNTVVFSTRTGVKIPINLVSAHLRGVRNQVTSFQPKWEVLPSVTTKSAFQNARYSGKTLDYIYEKSQIKRKIKEAVNDALIYSIGIWYFDVDSKKNITVSRIDPFDFLVDPNIKSANLNDPDYGAEYVILMNQVAIDAIKKNKDYEHTEDLQSDNKVAATEYKQFLLQATRNYFSASREGSSTVILKQLFRRERQENGEIKIRFIVYVDSMEKPLQNVLLDDDEYPFEILQGDVNGGDLYGEAWIKNLIPINRVIDALESHIFEYNHFFARGKWVIDKNSGVRVVVNQHGQILEKNRGATVTPVTVPPLPPSPAMQLENMRKYMEDLSGVHDVSLGRLPGTIRSGVAIAELRQSDATNQADLVDNLEDFLSRTGRKILKMASEEWTTTRLMSVTSIGGKPEYFVAIGEKGAMKDKGEFKLGEEKLPLAIIGRDNEVRVQVGSWLAYTKEARLEKLKELYRLGVIDQQSFLQHAEFGDIDGILQRTREERVLQARSGSRSQSVERDFGVQIDDESLALAENELMAEGIEQFAEPGDDHEVHIMVHKEDQENELVQAHIKQHLDYQKWETKMGTRPMEQVQGEEMGAGGAEFMDPAMGVPTPPSMPPSPETFTMSPPVGPGAPPFQVGQDLIT